MTRHLTLGLNGRLIGIGFDGKVAKTGIWPRAAPLAADERYRHLDVPTFLRRRLVIPGLPRGDV